MPVETFGFINSLDTNNPTASDGLVQGDDHIRGIKAVLKNTFTNITAAITATAAQINQLATGTMLLADTNGVNPSLAFTAEPNLGFARIVPGRIDFSGSLYGNGAVPTGAIVDFLSTSIPTGWYELNGQAVSRTGATAALFSMFGTTWGGGDGSTTFNLPNLTDRYRRSRGASPVNTLQADQNKAHTHTGTTNGGEGLHQHSGSTGTESADHTHTTPSGALANNQLGTASFTNNGNAGGMTTSGASNSHTHTYTTPADQGSHVHSFTTSSNGGSEARPLSIVVVTCIKA